MFEREDKCCRCGRSGNWTSLSYVGGDWWCRSCLWRQFDRDSAINYILINKEEFADTYPDGFDYLWDFLEGKEHDRDDDRTEEFISENLEDYVDWLMSNPTIIPVADIKKRWKEKQ